MSASSAAAGNRVDKVFHEDDDDEVECLSREDYNKELAQRGAAANANGASRNMPTVGNDLPFELPRANAFISDASSFSAVVIDVNAEQALGLCAICTEDAQLYSCTYNSTVALDEEMTTGVATVTSMAASASVSVSTAAPALTRVTHPHHFCAFCVCGVVGAFFDSMDQVIIKDGISPCCLTNASRNNCYFEIGTVLQAARASGRLDLIATIWAKLSKSLKLVKSQKSRRMTELFHTEEKEFEEEVNNDEHMDKVEFFADSVMIQVSSSSTSSALSGQVSQRSETLPNIVFDTDRMQHIAKWIQQHVASTVLCPSCNRPFGDYNHCSAVTCVIHEDAQGEPSGCGVIFCGICHLFVDEDTAEQAGVSRSRYIHDHVALSHSHGSSYNQPVDINRARVFLLEHQVVQAILEVPVAYHVPLMNTLQSHFDGPDTQLYPTAIALDKGRISMAVVFDAVHQRAFTKGQAVPACIDLFKQPFNLRPIPDNHHDNVVVPHGVGVAVNGNALVDDLGWRRVVAQLNDEEGVMNNNLPIFDIIDGWNRAGGVIFDVHMFHSIQYWNVEAIQDFDLSFPNTLVGEYRRTYWAKIIAYLLRRSVHPVNEDALPFPADINGGILPPLNTPIVEYNSASLRTVANVIFSHLNVDADRTE